MGIGMEWPLENCVMSKLVFNICPHSFLGFLLPSRGSAQPIRVRLLQVYLISLSCCWTPIITFTLQMKQTLISKTWNPNAWEKSTRGWEIFLCTHKLTPRWQRFPIYRSGTWLDLLEAKHFYFGGQNQHVVMWISNQARVIWPAYWNY